MLVIPSVPSRGGRCSGSSGLMVNVCKILVRKRNISILASDSPRQTLRPVNQKNTVFEQNIMISIITKVMNRSILLKHSNYAKIHIVV